MSAAKVLAQHQRYADSSWFCTCGVELRFDPIAEADHESSGERAIADHQLDALKAAGFAVVELPKSEDRDGPDWRGEDWSVWPDVDCTPEPELVVRAACSLRIDAARNFGSALLAAADAAEANS